MNKIRLDLDRVTVDSFATETAAGPAKGTVQGAWARTQGGPTCFTSCNPGGDPACTCPVP